MPNGKPGDGPVVDICVYGKDVFGPKVDALVREIDQYTSDYGTFNPFEPVEDQLWAAWDERELFLAPEARRTGSPEQDPQELYEALLGLRDRLRRERN